MPLLLKDKGRVAPPFSPTLATILTLQPVPYYWVIKSQCFLPPEHNM